MKILVCASTTPDTTTKISFVDGNTKFNTDGVQYIMNPYDEWYALVRALEIKEALGTGSVTLLTVGTAGDDAMIRKGLAIGADDAVRIDATPTSAFFTAKQIAEFARDKGFDLLFFGKETIDYNGSEVPAMVAELLDLPFVSYASQLQLEGNTAVIDRDIEGGKEVVEVALPLVISAAKGMAEQRIANMRGIMMSKSKPLQVLAPVAVESHVSVAVFELPKPKSSVKLVDPENMAELVRLLHEEAKVI